jgi:hypothetical protein
VKPFKIVCLCVCVIPTSKKEEFDLGVASGVDNFTATRFPLQRKDCLGKEKKQPEGGARP